jgi:phosphoribosylformylglycinamidine synthase
MGDVMGICDSSGLIFGLMPHPERFLRWTQHPTWTRLSQDDMSGDTIGLQMFKNAVDHVKKQNNAKVNCIEGMV